ncbi:MAG TPA: DUF58 domain-containing protein [Gaiella sp.]|jgi:uncharacterized protein (DUF58 family)
MSVRGGRPFALVPRRRFRGIHPGSVRTPQRGEGDEAAGSRPYRPGDRLSWIDWGASARLSAARGSDELVVREFFAQRAPRAVVVCDRRPSLGIYPAPLPWLDKTAAIATVVELVAASARAAQGDVGLVAFGASGPFYVPPGNAPSSAWLVDRATGRADAPPDALVRSLELFIRRRAAVPVGSFVFVVSDFLDPLPGRLWMRLRGLGWDVTPVLVQDPVWEQSFPRIGGLVVPFVGPGSARGSDVWITRRRAREAADANERRLTETIGRFRRLGFDPVVVGTSDPGEIARLFHGWAARRRVLLRRGA